MNYLREVQVRHYIFWTSQPQVFIFDDIQKLLLSLHKLVDSGNTVVVIEHNLDVIKTADHIIDLGPDGGENGGQVVAMGTPEKITESNISYTGQALKDFFSRTKILANTKYLDQLASVAVRVNAKNKFYSR